MAFFPLTCLSFSLGFAGRTIPCFFIAKSLLHFDSEFCSGSSERCVRCCCCGCHEPQGSAPLFQSRRQPLRSSLPGSGGLWVRGEPAHGGTPTVRSPQRAAEQEQGTAPPGPQPEANPGESPAAASGLRNLPWGSTSSGSPAALWVGSTQPARAAVPPAPGPGTAVSRLRWPGQRPGSRCRSPRRPASPAQSPPQGSRSQQRSPARETRVGLEGTSKLRKGHGVYSKYFSNIALPFVA